jgi:hypothetical protein
MPCCYFDGADRGELLCDEDGTEVLKFLPTLAKEQPQDGDERELVLIRRDEVRQPIPRAKLLLVVEPVSHSR